MENEVIALERIFLDFDFEVYGMEKICLFDKIKLAVEIQRNQILQKQLEIGAESVALLSQQLAIIKGES